MPVYWPTRAGGATERDSEPVPETAELLHGSSTSSMSFVQGGCDLSTGKGSREEAGRVERELREEQRAQWMATLRGPGWARKGRCHIGL